MAQGNDYDAYEHSGSKLGMVTNLVMRCKSTRLLFLGVALLVISMVFVLQSRMGHGTLMAMHEVFFDQSSASSHKDSSGLPEMELPRLDNSAGIDSKDHEKNLDRTSESGKNNDGDDDDVNLPRGVAGHHDHKDKIRFVLHESELGAPEFIGRNQKDVVFDADDPKTMLNQQDDLDGDRGASLAVSGQDNRIAVGCALTTRNQEKLNRENLAAELPFFKGLLTSFCSTATRGYSYHFYVAHDHSDPFFRIPGAHDLFREVFRDRILHKCPRRVDASLHLVECEHSGHPAWAQNDAMMAAYMDNMDFYYRVNDDTVMETTGWTEKFITELARFNPPNVGVVGPWFREGNVVILTHDFVHRSHVDIFGFYYPRVFTDWFADDWITGVYWPERSRKVPGTRVQHTMEKGQRYVAHYEKASQVHVEVEIGRLILRRYIERAVKGGLGGVGGWDHNITDVISMSLHAGDSVDSLYGVLRYSQLLPVIFPRWRLRVYVSGNETGTPRVLRILTKKLETSGVEIVRLGNKTSARLHPSLWRYIVADDVSVKRFLVRDSTSRPTEREAAALEDWSRYESPFYCVRDHPMHASLMLVPGLVGGMPRLLRNLTGTTFRRLMKGYKSDGNFLQTAVWPKVKNRCFCHDSVSCTHWQGGEPFPVLRRAGEFVGQRYDANDQPSDNDTVLFWDQSAYTDPDCVFVKNTGFTEPAVRAVIRHWPVTLWSQDYHVTPVMDIKSLLAPIGVRMIDNSLSYYCGKVGTCAKNLKVINSDNGMKLGSDLIQQFYEAYKDDPEMKSVTAFVCNLPVAMCEAFEPFNKSMIIIATIRYEQGRMESARWRSLNGLLQRIAAHPRSVLAANNLYDAKYIEYFTGLRPLVLPNYCAYLGMTTYTPTRKQFLVTPIHSNELYDIVFAEFDSVIMKRNLNLVMFPLREMYPQYLYADLTAHRGIVCIPYQISMISLTEQYRMNIPLFLPSLSLLAKWHIKYQVVRQRTWSSYLMKLSSKSSIPGAYSKVPDPNNDLDEDAVRYWLKFADYYQWPHIIYFESIMDLVDKMLTVDLPEISRRMMLYNEKVRTSIKDKWSQVLLKIADGVQIPT